MAIYYYRTCSWNTFIIPINLYWFFAADIYNWSKPTHTMWKDNFRLKAAYQALSLYCNDFVVKKIDLSGITLANLKGLGPNLVTCTDEGAITFRKLWDWSALWWQNGGLGRVHGVGVFCRQSEMTLWQLANSRFSPNLARTRESMSCKNLNI